MSYLLPAVVNYLFVLLSVMIVSWYQFALFNDPDLLGDSDLTDDNDFINELNTELDWWEYQQETWLAIGRHNHCYHTYVYHWG